MLLSFSYPLTQIIETQSERTRVSFYGLSVLPMKDITHGWDIVLVRMALKSVVAKGVTP